MIKRKLIPLLALATIVFSSLSVAPVLAAEVFQACDEGVSGSTICADRSSGGGIFNQGGIISKIIQTLIFVVGAVSVIMIVIGGFRYVMSAGDSSAVNDAKNTVLYAIVGLVVAISAQAILTFVLNRL